jgi:hypothetical protein
MPDETPTSPQNKLRGLLEKIRSSREEETSPPRALTLPLEAPYRIDVWAALASLRLAHTRAREIAQDCEGAISQEIRTAVARDRALVERYAPYATYPDVARYLEADAAQAALWWLILELEALLRPPDLTLGKMR